MRIVRSVLLALSLAACSAGLPGAVPTGPAPVKTTTRPVATLPSIGVEASVVRVVDGDTIVVAIGPPKGTKVRLIGMDTPERNQCLFQAATQRMRSLVEGKRVRLVRDVSSTDRYGRLLRYVYVGDVFVNGVMVSDGYANAATFPPDVAHAREFVALERIARAAHRGLWAGNCVA